MKSLVKAMRKAWEHVVFYYEIFSKECFTDIADNSQLSDHLHDGEPDPDVLRSLRHGPSGLADELLGVQPDLHPVVDEGEQGRQGEGRHEDCDETKLEDWKLDLIRTFSSGQTSPVQFTHLEILLEQSFILHKFVILFHLLPIDTTQVGLCIITGPLPYLQHNVCLVYI